MGGNPICNLFYGIFEENTFIQGKVSHVVLPRIHAVLDYLVSFKVDPWGSEGHTHTPLPSKILHLVFWDGVEVQL